MEDFDYKKFLVENKLTTNSRNILKEEISQNPIDKTTIIAILSPLDGMVIDYTYDTSNDSIEKILTKNNIQSDDFDIKRVKKTTIGELFRTFLKSSAKDFSEQ